MCHFHTPSSKEGHPPRRSLAPGSKLGHPARSWRTQTGPRAPPVIAGMPSLAPLPSMATESTPATAIPRDSSSSLLHPPRADCLVCKPRPLPAPTSPLPPRTPCLVLVLMTRPLSPPLRAAAHHLGQGIFLTPHSTSPRAHSSQVLPPRPALQPEERHGRHTHCACRVFPPGGTHRTASSEPSSWSGGEHATPARRATHTHTARRCVHAFHRPHAHPPLAGASSPREAQGGRKSAKNKSGRFPKLHGRMYVAVCVRGLRRSAVCRCRFPSGAAGRVRSVIR